MTDQEILHVARLDKPAALAAIAASVAAEQYWAGRCPKPEKQLQAVRRAAAEVSMIFSGALAKLRRPVAR